MWRMCAIWCMMISTALADNMVLDFDSIERIELNLKSNQTLMINHKTGRLLGIMEIGRDGKVRTLPIPRELLGKNESDIMGGSTLNQYDSHTSHIGDFTTTIYIRGKEQIIDVEQVKSSQAPKKREGEFEWDKSKIIYEQNEEILDIMR
ncbi:hypothetical protein [Helicobacter marmotae]|uniref:Uncharacterized protein n=1 Tax=Helicobacter marmotae TaxID=152490 RepID=A0A3D8I378_9HELI|nr:hypothetical protein [Helicobacter marmotae]RDU59184.1 hypothetical protein CQA63_07855 [Helicobacter marmotae]